MNVKSDSLSAVCENCNACRFLLMNVLAHSCAYNSIVTTTC